MYSGIKEFMLLFVSMYVGWRSHYKIIWSWVARLVPVGFASAPKNEIRKHAEVTIHDGFGHFIFLN